MGKDWMGTKSHSVNLISCNQKKDPFQPLMEPNANQKELLVRRLTWIQSTRLDLRDINATSFGLDKVRCRIHLSALQSTKRRSYNKMTFLMMFIYRLCIFTSASIDPRRVHRNECDQQLVFTASFASPLSAEKTCCFLGWICCSSCTLRQFIFRLQQNQFIFSSFACLKKACRVTAIVNKLLHTCLPAGVHQHHGGTHSVHAGYWADFIFTGALRVSPLTPGHIHGDSEEAPRRVGEPSNSAVGFGIHVTAEAESLLPVARYLWYFLCTFYKDPPQKKEKKYSSKQTVILRALQTIEIGEPSLCENWS